MSTIRDVAERAGVSTMTVSRVVNRTGYISQETRARVEAAIAELGYVANSLARSLRSKKTRTLALIITDITNPFFTTLARGVEDVASEQGFNVIFCNTDESASKEAKYLTIVVQKQVDGILLVPARSSVEPVAFLRDQGVPVVILDRRVPDCSVDSVRCDSEAGAYQLMGLLIELGHRHVAVLSGPAGVSTAADRVAGCRRAWLEAGLDPAALQTFHGEYTQTGGRQLAQEVLKHQPQPTALFTANNFIAIGAYRAVTDAGLRVPQDVTMVTFDDLPPQLVADPFFTVITQPAYEMGHRATERLLARIADGTTNDCQELVLPFELIVRRSSGPPHGYSQ